MRNSIGELASMPRKAIGTIQSATGSISVAKLDTFFCDGYVGDRLYLGDVVETGPDSSVRIALTDGSIFTLSSDSRLELKHFAFDSDGSANAALFTLARGAFGFSSGQVATTGGLWIDTAFGSLRGRTRGFGIVTLSLAASLAAMAVSLLRDVQNAHALSTDDDAITLKDSDFGTFEIVTKSGTVVLVDDPGLTYSVDQDGSVARIPNSSARMEELQFAQQAVLGTYSRGVQGPAGSSSPLDFQGTPVSEPLTIPINFRPLDPIPERIELFLPLPLEASPQLPGPPPNPPAPQPPVITAFTFDSGIDGDRITNNNALVLIGTADAGTIVTIFDGGTRLGSTSANGSGVWSFETGTLSDGEHAFSASAGAPSATTTTARSAFTAFALTNESEPGAASKPYIVVIDTKPPSAPVFIEVAVADGFADLKNNLTVDTTPTLTVAAEAGSVVTLYRDGVLAGTATETSTPGIFTFTSAELADGCYAFTATATDAANNTSPVSCRFEIEIDGAAPLAPEIISLADNCYCPERNLTDDATPTLTIAAEAGSTVRVYRDGDFAGLASETSKAGIFTFTSAALADDSYTFTAKATDRANNTSSDSAGFAIAIATSDPNDFDNLAVGRFIVVASDGTVHGTSGSDAIKFKVDECDPGRTIYAGAGHDYINGSDQSDNVYGGSGNDGVNGNRGDDIIFGGFGNDTIYGGKGNDTIAGGFGADFLSGCKGHDTFIFLSELDSPPCQPDTISDFESRCDRIDLSQIDANTNQASDQVFIFVGQTDTPTVVENSVTWYYDPRTNKTCLLADTDGESATAEIEIALAGRVTLNQDNVLL